MTAEGPVRKTMYPGLRPRNLTWLSVWPRLGSKSNGDLPMLCLTDARSSCCAATAFFREELTLLAAAILLLVLLAFVLVILLKPASTATSRTITVRIESDN